MPNPPTTAETVPQVRTCESMHPKKQRATTTKPHGQTDIGATRCDPIDIPS